MSILTVSDIYKSFGNVEVIKGLSFTVEDGQFLSLLGPSGCGKTTMLRMISGLILPTSGQIAVDSRDITFIPPYNRNIGMVFQNYALFPHMTVEKNISFGLSIRGKLSKKEIKKRVDEGLELVRLAGYGKRYPRELSGGQQQRVALARIFVLNPTLLLLDEPLSNLDAKLRTEMRSEIRTLQQELKLTTLFVTHDQEEALTMSDSIGLLHNGKFAQIGSPRELYEHPQTEFVASFIGKANLFKGEIIDKGKNGVCIIKCGENSQIKAHQSKSNYKVGERVTISVRPECMELSLSSSGDPENCYLPVEILQKVYIGSKIRFMVNIKDIENTIIEIDMSPYGLSHEFDSGANVYIQWPVKVGWIIKD